MKVHGILAYMWTGLASDLMDAYPTFLSNSPLLPLLLMSLATQKHSPDTAKRIMESYDYVVVGAGASGSAVAARLSEVGCVSVLLLEAGPPPPLVSDVLAIARNLWFTDIDWQYKTASQKYTGYGLVDNQLSWPGGKTLGGSTVINAALYIRGNKKDYDGWSKMGAKGWSFDEVLPYFKKMEDNRDPEYVANGFHGVGGPVTVMKPDYDSELKSAIFQAARDIGYKTVDPNTGTQTGFFDFQADLRNNQRCSTAKAYLVPAENRTNFDILPNAFVRKVILKNGRAKGVLFDYKNRTYFVKATREIILSAGAINTPKILMLSGIGPREELLKHGIPVIADLPVGRNLQDHGGTSVDFVLSPDIKPFPEKLSDDENIEQFIRNRTGPLASPEGVSNMAFLQGHKIDPAKDNPNYELYFAEFVTLIPKMQWNLKPEAYQQVYAPYEGKPLLICISQQLNPRARGTVTLRSDDPFDDPVIDPNYLSDPRDVEDFVSGMKACKRIVSNRYMSRVVSRPFQTSYPGCETFAHDEDLYFRCHLRMEIFTMSHPCGTARMGDKDDPRTVVDPELRIKGVEGLRVVDNSIMPTLVSGNTGVPAIMIGEKAADIIKQSIECYNPAEEDTITDAPSNR